MHCTLRYWGKNYIFNFAFDFQRKAISNNTFNTHTHAKGLQHFSFRWTALMCCSRWSFFENICWQMIVTLLVFLFQVDFFVVFFEMVYLWKYLLGNVIDMKVLLQVGCLGVFSEDLSQKNIYWQIFVGLFFEGRDFYRTRFS